MYPQYNQPIQSCPRGNPPVVFNVPVHPNIQQYFPLVISDVINYMASKANGNALRSVAYTAYSANNWNNQAFAELCQLAANHIANQMQYNGNYDMVAQQSIDAICTAALGIIYRASLSNGNPIQLQPQQVNEALQLEQRYHEFSRQVGMNTQPQYSAPTMTYAAPVTNYNTGMYAQPTLASVANAAAVGTSGLVANPTTAPALPSTTGDNTGWKRTVVAEEAITVPATATTPAVEVLPPADDIKPAKTPRKDGDWLEVKAEDAPWSPSAECRYPLAYDPRQQQRIVFMNSEGFTKEEFEKVDYDAHAIATPFTYAEQQRVMAEMKAEYGTAEINEEDVRNRIIRAEPLRTEYRNIVLDENVANAGSIAQAVQWSNLLREVEVIKADKEGRLPPEVLITFSRILTPFVGKRDLVRSFFKALAETRTWEEARQVLTRYADTSLAAAWRYAEEYLTEQLSLALNVRLGVEAITFDSFYEDYHALVDLVKEQYGDLYYGGLTTTRRYEAYKHFQLLSEEEMAKDEVKPFVMPWGVRDVGLDVINVLATHHCHALINESELELPFHLERGRWVGLTYEGAGRIRTLADTMLEETKDLKDAGVELYIFTRDGVVFQITRALVDESLVLIKRVH